MTLNPWNFVNNFMEEETQKDRELKGAVAEFSRRIEKIGPRAAFGDAELIKYLHQISERMSVLETTDPCRACDGIGRLEHDCNCPHCSTEWVECEKCFGTGRIEKEI